MTHVMVDREERLQHGITDGLVRFSVGYAHSCPCGLFKDGGGKADHCSAYSLEHKDDLVHDLEQALAKC